MKTHRQKEKNKKILAFGKCTTAFHLKTVFYNCREVIYVCY